MSTIRSISSGTFSLMSVIISFMAEESMKMTAISKPARLMLKFKIVTKLINIVN